MSSLQSFESEGFKLKYSIEGKEGALPVIVIGSAIYYPRTFSQNLRHHLQLIFMDHRGFAEVPANYDQSAFELDKLIDDVELLRKKLNLDQVIILGHSGHAYMALEYARKYPDYVSHIVLIAAGPDQSANSRKAAEQYLEDSVCTERKAWLNENLKNLPAEIDAKPEEKFITLCKRLGAISWYDYKFDSTPLWEGVKVNQRIFDYLWGEVFANIDITKDLDKLNMPILLALGKFDYLVAPFYSWNTVRNKFKNLTIRLFDKSSHTPQLEEPKAFDKALLDWIKHVK